MLAHTCMIKDSNCSTVLSLLCCIFLYKMYQKFSVDERSGLQAGQLGPQFFYYEAMLLS